jgi:hypothetical protein
MGALGFLFCQVVGGDAGNFIITVIGKTVH